MKAFLKSNPDCFDLEDQSYKLSLGSKAAWVWKHKK